ncbi:MAG: hypothetical protein FWC68_04985 [Oscillospiraceae bacterium]|nr:hypothetical protein [Oscillospiraceae bacterium]
MEDINNLSQMELDVKEINLNYSLGLPLRGIVTSRFGYRDYMPLNIPRFHTGIDIAANTGTVIVAAKDGNVTLVSGVRKLSGNMLRYEMVM